MTLPSVRLPDGRVWLRVADPAWKDPLSPFYAAEHGGRWNPPGSFPTLYLNADPRTSRLQIGRMLAGSPVHPDDLDDDAFVLIAATLPRDQTCADATTRAGLRALDLPDGYPQDGEGGTVAHPLCQQAGARVHEQGFPRRVVYFRRRIGWRGPGAGVVPRHQPVARTARVGRAAALRLLA